MFASVPEPTIDILNFIARADPYGEIVGGMFQHDIFVYSLVGFQSISVCIARILVDSLSTWLLVDAYAKNGQFSNAFEA